MKKKTKTEQLEWRAEFDEMLNYVALMNAFSTVEFLSAEYLGPDDFDKLIEIRDQVLAVTKPKNKHLVRAFLQHSKNCIPLSRRIQKDAKARKEPEDE